MKTIPQIASNLPEELADHSAADPDSPESFLPGMLAKMPTLRSDDTGYWLNWLKEQKHTVHEDGTISVDGDVVISRLKLKEIPFWFREVSGHFYCGANQLTSLAGCPRTVGGNFECANNQLTSLQGSPQEVGGNFYCHINQLTSLQGCPQKVGGGFYCFSNLLTSLAGIGKVKGGIAADAGVLNEE